MSPDDTVWLAHGLPGIIVGLGNGKVSILWPTTLTVTRHLPSEIVFWQPFQAQST